MSAAEARTLEPVQDAYGWRLAVVLWNEAEGGLCPWAAAGRCHHCDIGLGEGAAGDAATNLSRLEALHARRAPVLARLAHLLVYNSGSALNPRELSPVVLDAALDLARTLPRLVAVSVDTREPFVTPERLLRLARRLGPGRTIRPILGLETADDARRALLDKRMPREAVARAFAAAGEADRSARADGAARVGVDVNVLVGGPGTGPASAAEDAAATARFALALGAAHGVAVDLNVHPYYPSARGQARFPGHPRCDLATTAAALRAIDRVRRELTPAAVVFVGWQDEGHDQEPARRRAELATARAALARFNVAQDVVALDGLA